MVQSLYTGPPLYKEDNLCKFKKAKVWFGMEHHKFYSVISPLICQEVTFWQIRGKKSVVELAVQAHGKSLILDVGITVIVCLLNITILSVSDMTSIYMAKIG